MNERTMEISARPRNANDANPRIAVDRAWIGAPEGTIANPTVLLAVLTFALLAVGTWGYLAAVWPVWVTVAIHAVAIYVSFTVVHEAMHGVAHRDKRVGAVLGRVMSVPLTLSFPMFRAVHYEHHSHTNDPDRDPDFVVAGRSRWLLPLYCLVVTAEYRRHYYGRRMWRSTSEFVEAATFDAIIVAAIAAAAYSGLLVPLAVLWIVPALIAVVALAFAFDYLPHAPYDSAERYYDTRVYPGKVLNGVLLGQNYHLIHHLWTTIPWFRYQEVFRQIRPQLEARGSRIGWKIEPLPESHALKEAA